MGTRLCFFLIVSTAKLHPESLPALSSQLTTRLVTSDLPATLEMRTIVLALLLAQLPQSEEGRVKRIVGGKKSRPHKYPWQTYIEIVDNNGEDSRCGGTII